MNENLISFETAKLAKEKEFRTLGMHYYYGNNKEVQHGTWDDGKLNWNGIPYDNMDKPSYAAPTQSLLQKWLREVHNIEIDVNSDSQNIYHCTAYTHLTVSKVFFSKVYEQALEKGLYQALLLI